MVTYREASEFKNGSKIELKGQVTFLKSQGEHNFDASPGDLNAFFDLKTDFNSNKIEINE